MTSVCCETDIDDEVCIQDPESSNKLLQQLFQAHWQVRQKRLSPVALQVHTTVPVHTLAAVHPSQELLPLGGTSTGSNMQSGTVKDIFRHIRQPQ